MTANDVDVYIIPSEDAHQSEYPPSYDKRRTYISGLSGSAGRAVVTQSKAALWTDGRYYLQAEDELDCNWILMKQSVEGVPSITEWLLTELKNSPSKKVGASPFLMSSNSWSKYVEAFKNSGITMKSVPNDLIDAIWTSDRPEKPDSPINALPLDFSGKSWQNKIEELRQDMTDKSADAFIVTSLDETAWLFNMRANDILYNPFVVSYAIVEMDKISTEKKIWVTLLSSQGIFEAIPEIRDAVALIKFMAKLEREVKEGKHWTEVSAAVDLKKYRAAEEFSRGLSFPSISGSGSNGAIIHYTASNATDKKITTEEMYLLDSGGQYLDGTTDVTRTFHFGTPTAYEKECYTRVLMGHIDLAMLKWPRGLYGRDIDAVARKPLWDVGLIYRHGTGHGIGAYLSVHEGPGRISIAHAVNPNDEPLDEHMFFSDEPGYYEDGKFGIRLETIVMVEKKETKYDFPDTQMLGFTEITLVPYEPNLINFDMLSEEQVGWLNAYHVRVEKEVGPKLTDIFEQWLTRHRSKFNYQRLNYNQQIIE
ncbi:hypothetical protein LOTGIDRAFT_177452 [Lottia gigantea]|uniref:Xaa-Pro aminopeptidase 1 n=1 Tax=Lottia gigantea TaxID=225164 RepID=V4BL92_LOTGI|nr:hypothetical protein LOTGIDRAFT_177452 [Lottia gigantea]ESO89364.1 hypothetical protein LOTGIDRAFT_177452 [Lottia gigantea]